MNRLFCAATGLFLLAACGDSTDEASEADIDADMAATGLSTPHAGTYTSSTEDGVEVSVVLDADGTYTVTDGGQQVETGTWEENERGTCTRPEGGDAEACYQIAPSAEESIVEVTGPDNIVMRYRFEG